MHHFFSFFTTPDFLEFIQHFGYLGIYIWFITIDQFTPLPEEISLLTIGYLVSNHIFNPFFAGFASLLGFLTIDVIYYFLASAGSSFIAKRFHSESGFMARYKEKLKKHMPKTLLILSFIPRVRLWAPILVGSMRLPFKKFLFYNTVGLTLFTALYLTLGIMFHQSLESVFTRLEYVQTTIFIVSLALIAIVLIFFVHRNYMRNQKSSEI